MTKMTIPEIREAMYLLVDELRSIGQDDRADRLSVLANETTRRSPIRRTRIKSRKITPILKAQIKAMAWVWPSMSMQDLGTRFKVNPGRISEVLSGKR